MYIGVKRAFLSESDISLDDITSWVLCAVSVQAPVCSSLGLSSTTVCLFVSDPPHFVVRPKQYYQAEVYDSVTMHCTAEGSPKPTMTWRKVRDVALARICACVNVVVTSFHASYYFYMGYLWRHVR